jgi:hypothetical protein
MIQGKHFDRAFLIGLVCLQAFLASAFYFREIAWYPAARWDQTVFLSESYELEERVFAHGPIELVKALWSDENPNGLLLPIEGALSGIVFGGTRFPQLLVNFLFFIGLQLLAFALVKNIFNHRAYGYLLVGLILCEGSPWYWPGGLFDFRQDFSAYCLYGAWTCAVLRSGIFAERRWSIAAGAIGAILVLHRYLTIVYLSGVLLGLAALFTGLALIWRARSDLAGLTRYRLRNLIFSVLTLSLICLPILVRNWENLYDYYVVGHVLSGEQNVRAAGVGVFSLTDHLLFYPRSLVFDHLGLSFIWAVFSAVAVALMAFVGRKLGKWHSDNPAPAAGHMYGCCFLVLAILFPMTVLTLDTAKSSSVVSIIGVPVALLVVYLVSLSLAQLTHSWKTKLVSLLAALSMLFGLYNEIYFLTRHLPDFAQREDFKRYAELDKWLTTYAAARGWRHPKISFDTLLDLLQSSAITSSGYEQTGELIDFETELGEDIMSLSRDKVFSFLSDSDIVVLTTKPKTGVYPVLESIRQIWPDMKSWCDHNMDVVKTETFSDFAATVYVRRGP